MPKDTHSALAIAVDIGGTFTDIALVDHATGETRELATGDSLFVRDGSRVTWDVSETLTKVFFGRKPGGY